MLGHQAPRDTIDFETLQDDTEHGSGVLQSIEASGASWSSHRLPETGLMTPSSSSSRPSQAFSELVECLQRQMTELKSKVAADQQKMDNLGDQKKDLEDRNAELQQRNEALQKQLRQMEDLLGLVWDAFEDKTDPQSRLGVRLRKSVMEAVPSAFDFLDTNRSNSQPQAPKENSASNRHVNYPGQDEERRQASASQTEPIPMEMPSDFSDFSDILADCMGPSVTESNSFDEMFFDKSFDG